jgi:hypothetical protein
VCAHQAITYKELDKEDADNNIYFVGEHLAVHSIRWSREEIIKKRR